jgi:hypothetical protein
MDIFLSIAAQKALAAIAALAKKARPGGFLLGHVRGGRYFVESAIAASEGDWAEHEPYDRLDMIEPGRIIGFFVFSRSLAERRRIGQPHACGKAVLAAAKKPGGKLEFQGSRIDYTGRFVFDPLPVIEEKETAP